MNDLVEPDVEDVKAFEEIHREPRRRELELPLESSHEAIEADTTKDEAPHTEELSAEQTLKRVKDLPRELGVLLVSVGVLGFVLPGVAGTPAIIAGGLVLWPKAFGGVETWFHRRFPTVHGKSMQQLGRYLDDLERRYPQSDTGAKA